MANELNCVQIKRRRADISNPSRRRRPDYTNNSINVLPWWLFENAEKNEEKEFFAVILFYHQVM